MASHGVPRVSGAVKDKSEAAKEKERRQIQKYQDLEEQVRQKIQASDHTEEAFGLTTQLLKQNPEYYTIWNFRRTILLAFVAETPSQDDLEDTAENAFRKAAASEASLTMQERDVLLLLKEDLQFLVPLLKQFPKCYWIWDHRIWLLNEATVRLPAPTAIELWQFELGLVTKMLALDSRNFHGWDYRRRAVSELERLSGKSMVSSEFDYTTKMIKSNLSNFSAWHNRSQLIPRLLDERNATDEDRRTFFGEEIENITTALYTDPYDQSLWFYHQYLMSTLDADAPTNSAEYSRNTRILLDPSDTDRATYLEQELASIREMLDGAEDCKYIYQALLEYSVKYRSVADPGKQKVAELQEWLETLKGLDTLRRGRWQDLEAKLEL